MNYLFNTLHPTMKPWGARTNLFVDGKLPFVYRRVKSIAEALQMGGLMIWDANGRRQYFIGDDARALFKNGDYIFKRARTTLSWLRTDGARLEWKDSTTQGYSSGRAVWESEILPETGLRVSEVSVCGIVSQGVAGWGGDNIIGQAVRHESIDGALVIDCFSRALADASKPDDTSYFSSWPLDKAPFARTSHRGGIVSAVALPQTRNKLVAGQRPAILDGVDDKVKKYVDRAIDWYVSTHPDKILYVPIVVQWDNRGGGEFTYTVAPMHSDKAVSTDQFVNMQPNQSLPPVWYVKPADAVRVHNEFADPAVDGWFGSVDPRNQAGTPLGSGELTPARARTPQNEPATGITRANTLWAVYSGYEGTASKGLSGMTPFPFWHDEFPGINNGYKKIDFDRWCVKDRARGAVASTIAGIDLQWALRGVIPAISMNADGTKRTTDWAGSVTLSDLFKKIAAPKLPAYSAEVESTDPVQRRLDIDRVNNAQPRLKKLNKNWESFWDPVAELEDALQLVFDEAYRIAKAEN